MALTELPSDLLANVMADLPVADVLHVGMVSKGLSVAAKDPSLWHNIARCKWGDHIPVHVTDDDWKTWCCKRMCLRSIRQSPFQLLQESYPDPWQHITVCVLMTRTSGGPIIKQTISQFLALCVTPSHVLAASTDVLEQLFDPLGLQANRARAVKDIARGFLETDWNDPCEFWGCGEFVSASWRIFCKGDLSGNRVGDVNLKRYIHWAKHGLSAAHQQAIDTYDTKVRTPTGRKRERLLTQSPPAPESKKQKRKRFESKPRDDTDVGQGCCVRRTRSRSKREDS